MNYPTTARAAAALTRLDQRTNATIAATVDEMRTAAVAIAAQARHQHPTARWVHLDASDQGDWMDATGWAPHDPATDPTSDDARDRAQPLDLPEDVAFAAWCLYTPQVGADPRSGAVPGLWATDRRGTYFVMDIDHVLAHYDPQPTTPDGDTPDGATDCHDDQHDATGAHIAQALAALISSVPETRRHGLIKAMIDALRTYPHPTAPTVCVCGLPMRSTPEINDDGDEVHTEPMSLELAAAVAEHQTGHRAGYDGPTVTYVWDIPVDGVQPERVAQMCADCNRLYTIPATETFERW